MLNQNAVLKISKSSDKKTLEYYNSIWYNEGTTSN